jgi:5-methylcytosine-specific restriction endonuclease McrA
MRYKSKRAKACDITQAVKCKVWERDQERCIFCGNPYAMPNAHFISRAHGGLGIEENVLTLCNDCHRRYDQTTDRKQMREFFKSYLQSKYKGWSEENLTYKKF